MGPVLSLIPLAIKTAESSGSFHLLVEIGAHVNACVHAFNLLDFLVVNTQSEANRVSNLDATLNKIGNGVSLGCFLVFAACVCLFPRNWEGGRSEAPRGSCSCSSCRLVLAPE
jgi:hypothetical protein